MPRHPRDPQDTACLRIGAVSRLTGVSADAIRVWERRYDALKPARSEGGGRLYTQRDVERLRLWKQLIDAGHAIGAITGLPPAELERLAALPAPAEPASALPPEVIHELFLGAVARLDTIAADRVLADASAARRPSEVVLDVVWPLLVEVGCGWKEGRLSLVEEHLASAAIRTHLGLLLQNVAVAPEARAVVCATPAGERHELGAMFAAIFAASSGARAVYLGPNTPERDIAAACSRARATAVLLSVVALTPKAAVAELARLREALPSRVKIVVGGRGAPDEDALPSGVKRVTDLRKLGAVLGG